jgi:hypothetical protein
LCVENRRYEVGLKYFKVSKIIQIEWHPLSDSHLMVLTSNGILRMFNVEKDIEDPEQT